jgi:hypothetical protein
VERGSYLPHFLVFTLLHITVSRGFRLEGNFLTPPPPRVFTAVRAALLSRLLCFHAYRLSLSARLASCLTTSSSKVTPPQGTARIIKILHKNAYALKRQKLTQSDENELEQTHLGVDDPLP